MPNYKNGRIYAIRAPGTDEVYVGSTICSLKQRMANHKQDYIAYCEGKRGYLNKFSILEREGCYIELIENYPCESKEELERREGEIYRAMPNSVNMKIPGRTLEEYRAESKIAQSEYRKDWYERNREKVLEKARLYYQTKKANQRKQGH